MIDCVSYSVFVLYRDVKLNVHRLFSSWRDAGLFVLKIVSYNRDYNAVMPLEVKMQFIPKLPN